jgi:esterase/lipase
MLNDPNSDKALIVSDPRIVKGDYAYSRKFVEGLKGIREKALTNIPNIENICIFQGDNDPETTVEEAIYLYNNVKAPKELHVISGANHKYNGSEKEVSFLTVSWYKRKFHYDN